MMSASVLQSRTLSTSLWQKMDELFRRVVVCWQAAEALQRFHRGVLQRYYTGVTETDSHQAKHQLTTP